MMKLLEKRRKQTILEGPSSVNENVYKEVITRKCSRKFQKEKLNGCVSGDNVTIMVTVTNNV